MADKIVSIQKLTTVTLILYSLTKSVYEIIYKYIYIYIHIKQLTLSDKIEKIRRVQLKHLKQQLFCLQLHIFPSFPHSTTSEILKI